MDLAHFKWYVPTKIFDFANLCNGIVFLRSNLQMSAHDLESHCHQCNTPAPYSLTTTITTQREKTQSQVKIALNVKLTLV